jgi:hypothetical protein
VAAGAHISTDPSAATPSATAKKRASSWKVSKELDVIFHKFVSS